MLTGIDWMIYAMQNLAQYRSNSGYWNAHKLCNVSMVRSYWRKIEIINISQFNWPYTGFLTLAKLIEKKLSNSNDVIVNNSSFWKVFEIKEKAIRIIVENTLSPNGVKCVWVPLSTKQMSKSTIRADVCQCVSQCFVDTPSIARNTKIEWLSSHTTERHLWIFVDIFFKDSFKHT